MMIMAGNIVNNIASETGGDTRNRDWEARSQSRHNDPPDRV